MDFCFATTNKNQNTHQQNFDSFFKRDSLIQIANFTMILTIEICLQFCSEIQLFKQAFSSIIFLIFAKVLMFFEKIYNNFMFRQLNFFSCSACCLAELERIS